MKRPERPAAPQSPPAKPMPKPRVDEQLPKAGPNPRVEEARAKREPSRKPPPGVPVAEEGPSPDPRAETARGAGAAGRREGASASAERARVRKRYEKAEVRRFTRRARRRRIGWLIASATLAGIAALIATAVFSPILALREIRVDGTSRLDPAAIVDAVSGQAGTPLALLDEDRIRGDLAQFALIRSYATELVPPGTLVIHIVERSPLGIVVTPTGFDVVDAAGVVLESSPTRPAGLPVLQIDDEGPEGTGFAAMAEVLLALPPEVLAQVDSISARTRDDVTLALVGSDQRVVWGSARDSDRKADILAALLTHFAGGGPGEYDVSAPGSAVFHAD